MGRFISKRYSRMKSTVIPDYYNHYDAKVIITQFEILEGALGTVRCRVNRSLEP